MLRKKRSGQMVIMAALVMALMIFSVAISVYSASIQYQQLQYDQAREVLSNFREDFGRALTDVLATLTQRYNVTAEMETPRYQAYYMYSYWTRAAARSFASQGIQLSFNTTQTTPLQAAGTFYGYSADSRVVGNLTKLYWYTPQSISAVYAGFNANLTALGIYNWTEAAEYYLNTTLDAGPDFTSQNRALGPSSYTILNVTVGKENFLPVEDLSTGNFQVDYFDTGLNEWTTAQVTSINNGGGSYTLELLAYNGTTIPSPYWKYLMVWVQDTRGILTESYTYTHIDYTIQENALLNIAAPKPDETYDLELLYNGSVMWYNTILNMTGGTMGVPAGVVSYVPINLTNSQTTAISGGSQVLLNMNWNSFASYLDNPVDNYVFFDGSGTPLNSWLESGTANTSTNSAVWLKLNSTGIPGNSYSNIYLGFFPLGTNVMGVNSYTGEGPGLSGTYGQYDNGIRVFTDYWNFSGASLPSPFVSSAASTPSGVLNDVPITLTNAQSSAVAGGSQVMVNVNWANYASYLDNPVDNYVFYNSAGTPLYSWLESGTASSATNSVLWVKLDSSGIPANGAATIYLGFYATGTNVLGVNNYTGWAPQLSTPYGHYDDGAHVFTQYGGVSWSSFTPYEGAWDTTNGYLEQTASSSLGFSGGGPAALITSTSYPSNGQYVIESAFSYSSQAVARVGLIAVAGLRVGDPVGYRFIGQSNSGAGFVSFLNDLIAWVVNNAYGGSVNTAYTEQIVDNGGTWSGTLFSGYGVSGSSLAALAPTAYASANQQGATTGYVGVSAAYFDGTNIDNNPAKFQWFRMRAYLPNNVMPSASFGSVTSVSGSSSSLTGLTQASASSVQAGNAGTSSLISYVVPSTVALAAYAADGTSASFNLQNGVGTGFSETQSTYYIIGSFVSSSKVGELHNYATDATAAGTFNTQEYIILGNPLGSAAGGTTDTSLSVQWIRVRSYLPNGVNPTATFGSVSTAVAATTIIPIPLPPVKQFRVNATVTGPSDTADLKTNTVPSQVEVWNPDLLTPSLQFANWQLRFNASEKLVFELNYGIAGVHQQTARIYWLSDGDAAVPSPEVNITINGQFTDITNGIYTLRMVANGGYSYAIDWSMSMSPGSVYGNEHVEYTLTGVGWSPYPGGGYWFPDILPYGNWTILAGPIRAVAFRDTSAVWGSLNNTGSASGPWSHNETILIPYNTKYWQLYENLVYTMNYTDNYYYDFLTMISGGAQGGYVADWAYQRSGGGVNWNSYAATGAGGPTASNGYTDFSYWYSQFQGDFGEAVMSSTAFVNSITNMFGGGNAHLIPWVSSDYGRHVLDDDSMPWIIAGGMPLNAHTPEIWTAGIWLTNGYTPGDFSGFDASIYYRMFVEQYYPTVVAITGGF